MPEEAVAAIKQVAGEKIISETYKRAERAKAEAILQNQLAKQESKRVEKKKEEDIEKQLVAEETKINNIYEHKIEAQFPPRSFQFYWGCGTVLVFIAFALFSKESWVNFFVSMFFGWIPGVFIQNYFEEEQKKSTPYLSLIRHKEEELADVRGRKTTCQSCGTNIRFERKVVLLANPDALWNCPNCKTPIISPYSLNKIKPNESNLPKSSETIPKLLESAPQQESEGSRYAIYITGGIFFIWLISSISNNPTPSNPTVSNSLTATRTEQAIPVEKHSNVNLPISTARERNQQKSPNIPKQVKNHAMPKKKSSSAADLRHCLSLNDNDAIAKCAGR